jgi:hypothetical protein
MVKRVCQVCGKEFMVQESIVKKGDRKFCSRDFLPDFGLEKVRGEDVL